MTVGTDVADLDGHLRTVVAALKFGEVVPFLGAGANLLDRPAGFRFDAARREALPSGAELARYLAERYELTELPASDLDDLLRVAEWITLKHGEAGLYRRLGELLDADYPLTSLHELFAALPGALRANGWQPLQLIVTTNYDDLLERAFRKAGEAFDVLTYMAAGHREEEGRFLHTPPDGEPRLIHPGTANEYILDLDEIRHTLARPMILKLHGAVDRPRRERDSYVISEDDYIEYLARMDVEKLVPAPVRTLLKESNLLFLGYSLRDWNVRAMMYEIWSLRRTSVKSWAIQGHPEELDQFAWTSRGIEILPVRLETYVAALRARIQLPGQATGPADA